MRHAMQAFGLNLKHWAEDYPAETVVVGGAILAIGAFFGLLLLARGCEMKALGEEKETMGGCGVGGNADQSTVPAARWSEPLAADVPRRRGTDGSGSRFDSGQSLHLQAVAVPLVEGPREAPAGKPNVPPFGPGGLLAENRTGRAAEREVPSAASARRLPRGADAKLAQARLVCLRVTAYCPCALCCGNWADGVTASGTRADHPLAAAPPEFAFGTVMTVPGYGTVKVEDRGGAIKGNRLDVFFATRQEALNWGVRWLDVEIVGQ